MGILEGLLYMMWRGIAIGVIISAPMGPVGILCVQRTLEKGRRTGLYTGVGAAISDLIYCLLTGFGLSFVEEFLERNSNIIQLIGSVVLIAFGVYLFKSNPSRKLKKPTENNIPAGKNILHGFLFTFSNPLIIFLIIGLFARFNFMLPEIQFYHYLIGFIFIFIGALLWWYLVTFFVDKVRAHFNLRSMWLINKIIGVVIFLFAIVGIISATSGLIKAESRTPLYLNSTRGFGEFKENTGPTCIISNPTDKTLCRMLPADSVGDFVLEFRVVNLHNKSRGSYSFRDEAGKGHKVSFPGWGIMMQTQDDETLEMIFKASDNITDETYTTPYVKVSFLEKGVSVKEKTLTEGIDLHDGENAFRLMKKGNRIILLGGNREMVKILDIEEVRKDIKVIGFEVAPGGEIQLDNIILSFGENEYKRVELKGERKNLDEYLQRSMDPIEGIWMIFDRTLEDDYLRIGGDYRVAIIKTPDGYDIVYLSGAKVNHSEWEEGMSKGRLVPSAFEDIFYVEWNDAEHKAVPMEIKAQHEEGLLKIVFPAAGSELRLRKVTTR